MVDMRDSNWLADHSLELSQQYAGKWVAVLGEKVIGVGDTMGEADQQAARQRPEHDFILEHIDNGLDLPHVD